MVATNTYGSDQIPNFQWPQEQNETIPAILQETLTSTTTTDIVNTVKDIVNTFIQNQTNTVLPPTKNFQESSNTYSTIMETDGSGINEIFNSNNTLTMFNNTGFTETMNSSNTNITFDAITETIDTTVLTTATQESTETINFVTETVNTIADNVATTSEKVFSTFAETVTSGLSTEAASQNDLYDSEHWEDFSEKKTLYIVIGVILGALIMLMIILLIIYRRYKAKSGIRSGVYCVTDLKEVSISSGQRKGNPLNQHVSNYT